MEWQDKHKVGRNVTSFVCNDANLEVFDFHIINFVFYIISKNQTSLHIQIVQVQSSKWCQNTIHSQPKLCVSFAAVKFSPPPASLLFNLKALSNCVRITKHIIAALSICKIDTHLIATFRLNTSKLTLKQNCQSKSKRPHVNLNFTDEICSTNRRVWRANIKIALINSHSGVPEKLF